MVKVACIQLWHNDEDSKQDRITHAEELIDSASEADLILLPELWNIGFESYDMYRDGSETLDGETISRIAEKAKAVNAYILAGSIVENRGDSLYNTAVLLDPKGRVAATYSKIHVVGWHGSREAELVKSGEKIVTVKTDLGVLGLSICYDLRFPELFRKMAVHHGAEIFLLIAGWPIVRQDNWRELCHARANENLCFLVSCACAGFNRGTQFLGHSAIINPWGISIASAGFFETTLKSTVDTAEVRKARDLIPALKDIRLSI